MVTVNGAIAENNAEAVTKAKAKLGAVIEMSEENRNLKKFITALENRNLKKFNTELENNKEKNNG